MNKAQIVTKIIWPMVQIGLAIGTTVVTGKIQKAHIDAAVIKAVAEQAKGS